MHSQIVVVAALIALCQAGIVPSPVYGGYGAPLGIAKVAAVDNYDPNPQYSYAYDINVSYNSFMSVCVK